LAEVKIYLFKLRFGLTAKAFLFFVKYDKMKIWI
jgi:hypothetical protein